MLRSRAPAHSPAANVVPAICIMYWPLAALSDRDNVAPGVNVPPHGITEPSLMEKLMVREEEACESPLIDDPKDVPTVSGREQSTRFAYASEAYVTSNDIAIVVLFSGTFHAVTWGLGGESVFVHQPHVW